MTANSSMNGRPARVALLVCALLILAFARPSHLCAQELTVTAAVDRSEVYVGSPFTMQIQVEGSDQAERPDLSGLEDFQVQEAGGGQNNSQSISIVNGKMSRVDRRGYNFNYRLTAKRSGDLIIPSITVTAGGQTRRTQPIRVRAQPPAESEDFKLRLELSDQRAYVGQPVVLTVTWYVGKNVEEFQFNVPVLQDKRFEIESLGENIDPANQEAYVRIPLGSDAVIARKGRATLDGREFLTVRFEKVLIPRQSGTLQVPQSTVALRTIQGFQRRGSAFDDFFNDSFFGRRATYEDHVIPSNTPALHVEELPAIGKPDGFSGLIGECALEAQAQPTSVSVGDPITLTLKVTGPRYLQSVNLPALEKQPSLARDFRIPEERATGVVKGNAKVFTQTVRATHSGVTEIPPIELPYFNPKTGQYETAHSQPIALKVEGNRIVTAQDAEGRDSAAPMQTELEALEAGIAHNYDGADVLIDQSGLLASWLNSPLGWVIVVIPPVVYAGLVTFIVVARRRGADPTGRRARRAYREFLKRVQMLQPGSNHTGAFQSQLLEALRGYLGSRLRLPPGALTYTDVAEALRRKGVGEESLNELRLLFEQFEAGRYAGGFHAFDDPQRMIERACNLVDRLEQELR